MIDLSKLDTVALQRDCNYVLQYYGKIENYIKVDKINMTRSVKMLRMFFVSDLSDTYDYQAYNHSLNHLFTAHTFQNTMLHCLRSARQ